MKFTSEDLMKAMKLQVGDKVKVKYETLDDQKIYETYEIKQCEDRIYLENDNYQECMEFLVDTDYDILPRPKRVGDLKCDAIGGCDHCPLSILAGCYAIELDTLYSNLKQLCDMHNDQEIYNLLKARLDKEVNE